MIPMQRRTYRANPHLQTLSGNKVKNLQLRMSAMILGAQVKPQTPPELCSDSGLAGLPPGPHGAHQSLTSMSQMLPQPHSLAIHSRAHSGPLWQAHSAVILSSFESCDSS